jgi:hypothetical protein
MTKSSRSYSPQDLKVLWGLSGGICAFPNCKTAVIQAAENGDAVVIGEIAHILPSSSQGPRGVFRSDSSLADKPDNLLVLCPNHHELIDKVPQDYPEAILRAWKTAHETNIRTLIERWKDQDLFFALTHEATLENIAFYNEAVQFDYSNPNDYRRLQTLLTKYHLFEHWCTLRATGINDNRGLYELGFKLAHFMRTIGLLDDARVIYKHLESMLTYVFDPSTIEFKNQFRLIRHHLYGEDDCHEHEVRYCSQEFGDLHIYTLASLTCRGCALMRSGELDAAEEVLSDCATSLDRTTTKSVVRSAYLSFQLGKLNYLIATARKKSARHLDEGIRQLRQALDYFTVVRDDHVSKSYVHFFLYKALKMNGNPQDANTHFLEARRFFSSTPIKNMCHYDSRKLDQELGISHTA